jgi:hypothetical protein
VSDVPSPNPTSNPITARPADTQRRRQWHLSQQRLRYTRIYVFRLSHPRGARIGLLTGERFDAKRVKETFSG